MEKKLNKSKLSLLKQFVNIWKKKEFAIVILILLISIPLSFKYLPSSNKDNNTGKTSGLANDWKYEAQDSYQNTSSLFGGQRNSNVQSAPMFEAESIGFSTGGAKGIENFRENIKNNYLPLPTDLTYEGLFYEYYFDTANKSCDELFCPAYSLAASRNPFTNEIEYFMTVGLNSGIKASDFQRKKLNLVIVMDISGSMDSAFDSYYYDQNYTCPTCPPNVDCYPCITDNKTKMQVANESVVALTKKLNTDDRFGVVLFDNSAYLAKPLNLVGETNMDSIREEILEITPQGGTNMEAGLEKAQSLFEEIEINNEYENRIIFLTDAMPNLGDTSSDGLNSIAKDYSEKGIFTTFIGVGVDFNTELIEELTKIKGANYYSVHSSEEFMKKMDQEFEYMVTPLVFDLKLNFESSDFEIEEVYGSPEADKATGELMYINTLFPSASSEEGNKGGIVLLQLKGKPGESNEIKLNVSYQNRDGQEFQNSETISADNYQLPDNTNGKYDNNAIRKAILLTRYANMLKNWVIDERSYDIRLDPWCDIETSELILRAPDFYRSQWERNSLNLNVYEDQKNVFRKFLNEYMINEIENLNDETLNQEKELLESLINF